MGGFPLSLLEDLALKSFLAGVQGEAEVLPLPLGERLWLEGKSPPGRY